MHTTFDHAVVVVEALEPAIAAFRYAGFTVSPGGPHDAIPTANALVAFADGSYLELLALREPGARTELRDLRGSGRWEAHLRGASAVARRFLPNLAGPDGVADAAITGANLERFAIESRRRGTVMTGPVEMRRERRGQAALEWQLVLPADNGLPFLIEDRTPRGWRVPGTEAATRHANGARGIVEVHVRTPDPAAAGMALNDLFAARLAALPDGRARATFARVSWWMERGEPAGACAVGLDGVDALPPELVALGVRAPGPITARGTRA